MSYALQLQDHYAGVRERLRPNQPKAAVVLSLAPPVPGYDIALRAPLNMIAGPSWRFLAAYAALAGGVTAEEMMSPTRVKAVVRARQHAMGLIYQHTQASLPQVGRYFGRDHTTVLYSLKKMGAAFKLVDLTVSASLIRREKRTFGKDGAPS